MEAQRHRDEDAASCLSVVTCASRPAGLGYAFLTAHRADFDELNRVVAHGGMDSAERAARNGFRAERPRGWLRQAQPRGFDRLNPGASTGSLRV
jgi:hypothetical protein